MKNRGTKFNTGKAQHSLIPPEALEECAKVLTFGVVKYGRANWAKGIPISELLDATMRHINKFNMGIDFDDETKTYHIANACVNLMFAIWMMENKPEFDDRWSKDVKSKDKKTT